MLTAQDEREIHQETDRLKDDLLRSLLVNLDSLEAHEPMWMRQEDLQTLLALTD